MRTKARIVSCLAGVALALLATALPANGARLVVGGTAADVQSAPWAVFVKMSTGSGSSFCGGSIIDALHVLTAAHCVYDAAGTLVSVNAFTIRAGISSYAAPLGGDAEQVRGVSSLRVHPGYAGGKSASADDVALLALSAPLDLSGPAVQAIALPTANGPFPTDVGAGFAGFGRQIPTIPANGSLNWLSTRIDPQGSCGGFASAVVRDANAVALCAASPSGSVCNGDSGSGLVTSGPAPVLLGLVSAVEIGCSVGSRAIFAAVWPGEILRFIQGDDQPPVAPRRTPSTYVQLAWGGTLRAGNTILCESGGWQGSPALTYAFVNSQGEVLQQGIAKTLQLSTLDVGETVACRVMATNAGGTAVLSTEPTSVIAPGARLAIQPLAPVSAVRGRTARVRVVLDTGRTSGRFGVCITPGVKVGVRACASRLVTDGDPAALALTLTLHVRPNAPLGTTRLAIAAAAGSSRVAASALVRVASA